MKKGIKFKTEEGKGIADSMSTPHSTDYCNILKLNLLLLSVMKDCAMEIIFSLIS